MKMESKLFVLNCKDPKLIAIASGNIGQAVDGSSSRLADVLKLGVKKGVEIKRRSRGALLKCPSFNCTRNINPVPRSFVGPNVACPNCTDYPGRDPVYMRCSSCGYQRTSDYPSCQSCQKRLV